MDLLATLALGKYAPDTLYIVSDNKAIPALEHLSNANDQFIRIDGFNVIAPSWNTCHSCSSLEQLPTISSLVPSYSFEGLIVFSRSAQKLHPFVLLSGWDYPGEWGVWAVGQRAELTLPLPKAADPKATGSKQITPSQLILEMRALVNPSHPSQHIGIGVNGQAPLSFTLKQDDYNRIAIPLTPQVIKDGYVQLIFNLPTAKRPKDIGIGNDERLLSIGLMGAKFN